MAEIILGLATSHTPQISTPLCEWPTLADRDSRNPALIGHDGEFHPYADLANLAGTHFAAELAQEVVQAKYERAQRGVEKLAAILVEKDPDVVVVVGDDQQELFLNDAVPAIGLYLGDELVDYPLSADELAAVPPGIREGQWAAHADEPDTYIVHKELSRHLATFLTSADFDLTVLPRQPEGRGLGHAFTFTRRRLGLADKTMIVPVLLNTYYPPNVCSPSRCYALGQALRAGIEAFPQELRVAVIASGGLSHHYVLEELDRKLLDAMTRHDGAEIGAIDRRFFRGGTSEALNWIVAAGALELLPMTVVDYIPGYRSPAGTGTGMAFAAWAN